MAPPPRRRSSAGRPPSQVVLAAAHPHRRRPTPPPPWRPPWAPARSRTPTGSAPTPLGMLLSWLSATLPRTPSPGTVVPDAVPQPLLPRHPPASFVRYESEGGERRREAAAEDEGPKGRSLGPEAADEMQPAQQRRPLVAPAPGCGQGRPGQASHGPSRAQTPPTASCPRCRGPRRRPARAAMALPGAHARPPQRPLRRQRRGGRGSLLAEGGAPVRIQQHQRLSFRRGTSPRKGGPPATGASASAPRTRPPLDVRYPQRMPAARVARRGTKPPPEGDSGGGAKESPAKRILCWCQSPAAEEEWEQVGVMSFVDHHCHWCSGCERESSWDPRIPLTGQKL
jgi:hypothetical protein